MEIEWYGNSGSDKHRGVWNSQYDKSANSWDISYVVPSNSTMPVFTWSIYGRTGAIVATSDDPLNQFC